jgi:tripartite-type tricarboxylate transporter receptor subunit TctC
MASRWIVPILTCLSTFLVAPAQAQGANEGSDKRLRIVVPFAPGGQSDIFARLIAQKLTELGRQSVLVENRPGAGGSIGAGQVAKSRPDGLTLLLSDVAVYTVAPALERKLPYAASDLAPVIGVSRAPHFSRLWSRIARLRVA